MTERDFIYWLRGFLELTNSNTVTPEQVIIIREHLDKLFTPTVSSETENNLRSLSHATSQTRFC